MKLKGQYVKAQQHQYYLKDQLTQGGFSIIYTTNIPTTICKVQVLSVSNIAKAYRKQKELLLKLKHKNIVQLHDWSQISTPNHQKLGLLFMQNCSCGTALTKLQSTEHSLAQKDVITIFKSVAHALEVLHKQGIAHRDVKLQNMLQNQKKQWKLCDFGSCTTQIISKIDKTNREEIQQFIKKPC